MGRVVPFWELATERMTTWSAYLRGQADALRLPLIDTTSLSIEGVADALESLIRTLFPEPAREDH